MFRHRPVSNHDLVYLVDMTGQGTGIRLMLPARTCPVENEALGELKAALELEAFGPSNAAEFATFLPTETRS